MWQRTDKIKFHKPAKKLRLLALALVQAVELVPLAPLELELVLLTPPGFLTLLCLVL